MYRVRPYEGEKGVLLNEFVAADVHIPHFGAGVDPDSLNAGGVTLTRVRDNASIPVNVNTSGAGDSIVLSPIELLDPGTEYRFRYRLTANCTSFSFSRTSRSTS